MNKARETRHTKCQPKPLYCNQSTAARPRPLAAARGVVRPGSLSLCAPEGRRDHHQRGAGAPPDSGGASRHHHRGDTDPSTRYGAHCHPGRRQALSASDSERLLSRLPALLSALCNSLLSPHFSLLSARLLSSLRASLLVSPRQNCRPRGRSAGPAARAWRAATSQGHARSTRGDSLTQVQHEHLPNEQRRVTPRTRHRRTEVPICAVLECILSAPPPGKSCDFVQVFVAT